MKYLVKYEKITDTTGKVTMIVQNPIYEEPTEDSFYTEDLTYPEQENIPNMQATLKVDLTTKNLYYDYKLVESLDVQVGNLRDRQDATEAAILALMDVTVMG